MKKFCQSCGMPLEENVLGTNVDQTKSQEYCRYCYEEGKFMQDCTMEEMIEHCADLVEEFNKDSDVKFTREEAVQQMKQFFPTLARWKK